MPDPNDPITAANVGYVPDTYTSYLVEDGLRGKRLGVIRDPLAKETNPQAEDYSRIRGIIQYPVDKAVNRLMIMRDQPRVGFLRA